MLKERPILSIIASLLLLCVTVLTVVFYIAFGPRSVLLGFLFGAGLTLAVGWLGFAYPHLLAVADVRSADSRAVGGITRAIVDASDDPRETAFAIARFIGWCLTIFFAGATLLFALFAIVLRGRGELTSGLTGSAVMWGVCTVMTVTAYKFFARAGLVATP